jgi:hypothetical protein
VRTSFSEITFIRSKEIETVTYTHYARYALLATAFILASAASTLAQPVKVSIESAIANQIAVEERVVGWSVFVTFSKEFAAADSVQAEKASNYKIINISSGSQVPVSAAKFFPLTQGNQTTLQEVHLVLVSAYALNKEGSFYIFTPNLTFNGAPTESVPAHEIKLEFEAATDTVTIGKKIKNTNELPKPSWGLSKAKDRDSSDLYIAYELTKARGQATTGTGDLKVSIPFFKNFWKKTSRFSPIVDVKASSDAGADPDSLKFAFEWTYPLYLNNNPNSSFPYNSIYLQNSAKVEAPKNLDNINALWEDRWLFPSAQIGKGEHLKMFVDFFAGFELGKNLKSPLKSVEGKGLFRPLTGANLSVEIPIKNLTALKGFQITSSYIRRWPIKRELLVDKDANGNLVGLFLSKGPKDYSDSKFVIKVNDYFGPYVGYEWGRLPPNYELVDHKWTFGILFKSKVRAAGE